MHNWSKQAGCPLTRQGQFSVSAAARNHHGPSWCILHPHDEQSGRGALQKSNCLMFEVELI
jgi:hypothetical protein